MLNMGREEGTNSFGTFFYGLVHIDPPSLADWQRSAYIECSLENLPEAINNKDRCRNIDAQKSPDTMMTR